jgi:transposase
MADHDRERVLTDAQWTTLAPLIEACRPPYKTDHHDLRRTIEAIIWRHDNGAKWRQIPAELGPWWMAAQTFRRWSRLGVWERLLEAAQRRGGIEAGMAFLDGTSIRAHHKAAGAAKKGELQSSVTRAKPWAGRAGATAPRLA